jgi:hypothetical protein
MQSAGSRTPKGPDLSRGFAHSQQIADRISNPSRAAARFLRRIRNHLPP